MVRFVLMLLLIQLPLTGIARPALQLVLEKNKQQLGLAFNARIIASGVKKNLSRIDLSPLEKNFGVIVREYSSTADIARAAAQQQLTIDLYPRSTGTLHIAGLQFAGISTKTQEVEVMPAQNIMGPIGFEYQLSTSQPWQRQQVLLTVKVTTPNRFARLEAGDILRTDGEVMQIPPSKKTFIDKSQLETGWIIFPSRSGVQDLSLPAVHYYLQGQVARRFYLPNVRLNVRKLPDYIPPLMPVGKIYIDGYIEQNNLLTTGESYDWIIRLKSPELLSHLLPPVLRQINSDNKVRFQPAHSRRSNHVDINGSHGEIIHTIPFQSLSTGELRFPDLRIQYFDPIKGRVMAREYRPPRIWSVAIYWQLLFLVIAFLGISYLINKGWNYWLCLRRKQQYMNEAMQQISNAATSLQLRQALDIYARAEDWPVNLTLEQWKDLWNRCYSPSATQFINDLSIACYGKTEANMMQIKNDLLRLLKRRKSSQHQFFAVFG